jgi:hypothetical protein
VPEAVDRRQNAGCSQKISQIRVHEGKLTLDFRAPCPIEGL